MNRIFTFALLIALACLHDLSADWTCIGIQGEDSDYTDYYVVTNESSKKAKLVTADEAVIVELDHHGRSSEETTDVTLNAMPENARFGEQVFHRALAGYVGLDPSGYGVLIRYTEVLRANQRDWMKAEVIRYRLDEDSSPLVVNRCTAMFEQILPMRLAKTWQAKDAQVLAFGQARAIIMAAYADWGIWRSPNDLAYEEFDPLQLAEQLKERVFGQDEAVEQISDTFIVRAAGLKNPDGPLGTFLFAGPTGVGKTHLARRLAVEIFGTDEALLRFDMSEFATPYSLSRLIGSPPGVMGFDAGGGLTNALAARPKSVVLLDEIEKAHPEVLKVFLRAFDEGIINSGRNEKIDCRETLFILTTNLSAAKIYRMNSKGANRQEVRDATRSEMMKVLSPELYNRMSIIPFQNIGQTELAHSAELMLDQLSERILATREVSLSWNPDVIDYLTLHGYEPELGMRPLKRLVEGRLATQIAKASLKQAWEPGASLEVNLADLHAWGMQDPEPAQGFKGDPLTLAQRLKERVFGQDAAVERIADSFVVQAAGLKNPDGPMGVYLFAGPTGVGKTHLARRLATEVFGDSEAILRIDMSEFNTRWSATRLIGAALGYVDSEDGGILTNGIMEKPYSVVLLDEIDKADPEVLKILLRAFDEGVINTARNEQVDCRNVLFIMTTNLCADLIYDMNVRGYSQDDIIGATRPEMMQILSPELYNRTEVIPFGNIGGNMVLASAQVMLREVAKRMQATRQIELFWDQSLLNHLVKSGYEPELGMRPLRRLIERELVTELAKAALTQAWPEASCVKVGYQGGKLTYTRLDPSPRYS